MEKHETSRLILRPFVPEDASEYFRITRDKKVKQYVSYAYPNSFDEAKYNIEKYYCQGDFFHDYYFVLEDKNSHEMIGALIVTENEKLEHEVCMIIGADYRGKGYCVEALNKFFEIVPRNSLLVFYIERANHASLRVMTKLRNVEERKINNPNYAGLKKFARIV